MVNSAGIGVPGVRLESTGEVNDGVLTGANGGYLLTAVAPGIYIITPDKDNTVFTPPTRTVTVGSTGLTGVNFVAKPGVGGGTLTIRGAQQQSSLRRSVGK